MIKGSRYHFSLGGEWGIRSFSGELPLSSANVTKVVTKFREAENEERKLNIIFFRILYFSYAKIAKERKS